MLGLCQAGAVLVPVNTRFKGAEAADILDRSHARVAGHRHRLPRHRLRRDAARPPASSCPTSTPSSLPTVAARRRASAWADVPRPRPTTTARAEVARRAAAVSAGRPVRHPVHLGDDRRAQGRRADPRPHAARGHRLGGDDRPRRRRPLPDGQPVLPHVRVEGGDPGVGRRRRHDAPRAGVRRRAGARRGRSASRSPCSPARRRIYQSILDHPDRDRYDLSSLRVAVTGAADIPVELIRRVVDELPFPTIITGYGLTEGGTATATSPDDDVETIATTVGPRRGPASSCASSTPRARTSPPGEPGEIVAARRQRHVALPRRPGGDRRGPLGRRVAAHRRPRRARRRAAACASSGGPRTCSSSAGSTPTRPRSRTPCCATPTSSRPRSSASPTTGWARSAWRSSSPRPGSRPTRRGDHRVEPRADGQLQGAPAVEVVDELPLNATGKVVKNELRERAAKRRG